MTTPRALARRLAFLAPATVTGLALGLAMPRGPMSTGQSLAALAAALAVGTATGWLLRSRWAAVLAPAALAVAFELTRLPARGPTVDAIHLENVFGVIAFIAGRGFDAAVILAPMVVGALWGAAAARRGPRPQPRPQPRSRRSAMGLAARRATLGLASLVVLALVVGLARPASTEPIADDDGQPLPGSIAELVTVPIGGHEQSIMLRGTDVHAPVLLFLEGGPGGTATGSMRYAGEGLERNFVVATWDQRGTGRSAAALEPAATLTLEQTINDTLEVTEYLRTRFDQADVYLVGSSWGSTLGVLAVQRRPDLFRAYVGLGQMVDQHATDTLMYAESLAYATRIGDTAFEAQLRQIGTPPYTDMLDYPIAISSNPDWHDYTPGADHDNRSSYPVNLFVAEYTLTQQLRSMGAMVDTFALLYPQLQGLDFRADVPRLDVPVYVIEGAHEAPGRATLARQWFELLSAPTKTLVTFENSGHGPQLDEPGRFADFMADVVLPDVDSAAGAAAAAGTSTIAP